MAIHQAPGAEDPGIPRAGELSRLIPLVPFGSPGIRVFHPTPPPPPSQLSDLPPSFPRGHQVYTDTAVILNIGKGFISQAHVIWTVAKW